MTSTAQPDLFTRRPELTGEASATQPEPQRGPDQDASQRTSDIAPASPAVENAGPVLDWQPLPERHYPDGRKRWQGCWPTNYHTSGRKWHKKDGSTALERAEAKKAAQAEEDSRREKTAKEGQTA